MKYPWDLTPIVTIDRRVHLPLSKWRGHGVGFCSSLMGGLDFQVNVWLKDGLGFSPLGETGDGFVR